MSDDTILDSLSGKDPEKIFQESVLRRLTALEDNNEQTAEDIKELKPVLELMQQVKALLIKAIAGGILVAMLAAVGFMFGV